MDRYIGLDFGTSLRCGHRHPRAPRIAPNPRSGAAGTAAFSMTALLKLKVHPTAHGK